MTDERPPTFYFDLGSPYAYLAAERIADVLPRPVRWEPILLGGLFKHFDRGSWAETPARKKGIAEVERRAAEYGLPPIAWPDPWPGDMLTAMRAAAFAAVERRPEEFARVAFRRAFVDGRDLSQLDEVLAAAEAAGFDPEDVRFAIADPKIKGVLKAATAVAAARGVQGVPAITVGTEVFWGDDRLGDAAAALK